MPGVFAGLVAGVGCATLLILSNHDPFAGVNAGFLALCLNFGIAVFVSVVQACSHWPLKCSIIETHG